VGEAQKPVGAGRPRIRAYAVGAWCNSIVVGAMTAFAVQIDNFEEVFGRTFARDYLPSSGRWRALVGQSAMIGAKGF